MALTVSNALIWSSTAFCMVSNLALTVVTWRSKHLRSTCNLLIAVDAITLTGNCLVTFYFFVLPTFWQWHPIAQSTCFLLTFPQYILTEASSLMPLAIAVERLLNVLFPIWVNQRQTARFAAFITTFVYGWATLETTYIGVRVFTEVPNNQILCTKSTNLYYTPIGMYIPCKNYVVIGACWVIYFSIWAVMRARKKHSTSTSSNVISTGNADESFKRLTRSLLVIIVLISIGWITQPTTKLLFSVNTSAQTLFFTFSAVAITLGPGLIPPTLYATSYEYREAFSEFFAALFCCFTKSNQQHQPHQTKSSGVHPFQQQQQQQKFRVQRNAVVNLQGQWMDGPIQKLPSSISSVPLNINTGTHW